MKRSTSRSGLLLYLLLNIIVSAATTLTVLVIWDRVRTSQLPPPVANGPTAEISATEAPTANPQAQAEATATQALPASGPLIQIKEIIGAGDPQQEYVLLQRVGDGDLKLSGWQLRSEHGNAYTFPSSPELILYKGGAVQVYSRVGTDSPTEVFWNRTQAAWQSGEVATLVDAQGRVQATFQVP
jgi:hypothetical protein